MESGRNWQGIYLTRPDLAVTMVWEVFSGRICVVEAVVVSGAGGE